MVYIEEGGSTYSSEKVLASSHARVGLMVMMKVTLLEVDRYNRQYKLGIDIRFRAPEARRIKWKNVSLYGENNARTYSVTVNGDTRHYYLPDIVVGYGGHVWDQQIIRYTQGTNFNVTVDIPGSMNNERLEIETWSERLQKYIYVNEYFGYGSTSVNLQMPSMERPPEFMGTTSLAPSNIYIDGNNRWRKGGASFLNVSYSGAAIGNADDTNNVEYATFNNADKLTLLANTDNFRSGYANIRYSKGSFSDNFSSRVTYPDTYPFNVSFSESHFSATSDNPYTRLQFPINGRAMTMEFTISDDEYENFNRMVERFGNKFKYDITVKVTYGNNSNTVLINLANQNASDFEKVNSKRVKTFEVNNTLKNTIDSRIRQLPVNQRNGFIEVTIHFSLQINGTQRKLSTGTYNQLAQVQWESTVVDVSNNASLNTNCKLLGTDSNIISIMGSAEHLVAGIGTAKVVIPKHMFYSDGSNISSFEVNIGNLRVTSLAGDNDESGTTRKNRATEIPINSIQMRSIEQGRDITTFSLTAHNASGGSKTLSLPCQIHNYSVPRLNYTAEWNSAGGVDIKKTDASIKVHPMIISRENKNGIIRDTDSSFRITYTNSSSSSSSSTKTLSTDIFKSNVSNGTKVFSDSNGWVNSGSNLESTITIPSANVDSSNAYNITIKAKDLFGSVATQIINLPAWKPIIHINGKNKSVFFGGYDANANKNPARRLTDAVVFNSENVLARNGSNVLPYTIEDFTRFDSSDIKAGIYKFKNIQRQDIGIGGWDSNWVGVVENIVMNHVEFSGGNISSGNVLGVFHANNHTTDGVTNDHNSKYGIMQRVTVFNTGKVYCRTKLKGSSWKNWQDLTAEAPTVNLSGKADTTALAALDAKVGGNRVLRYEPNTDHWLYNNNNAKTLYEDKIYAGPYFAVPFVRTEYTSEKESADYITKIRNWAERVVHGKSYEWRRTTDARYTASFITFGYIGHNSYIDTGTTVKLHINIRLWATKEAKQGSGSDFLGNEINKRHIMFLLNKKYAPIGGSEMIYKLLGTNNEGSVVMVEFRVVVRGNMVIVGVEQNHHACKVDGVIEWAYKNDNSYPLKDITVQSTPDRYYFADPDYKH